MMFIGTSKIEISTEECFTLKEKRKVILSLKDRLKSKFKISVAEIDYQNNYKMSLIGVACISNDNAYCNKIIEKIIDFIEQYYPGRLIDYDYEVICR